MKTIYQQDSFKLDAERITEETHPIFGDMTVFHGVVIASEIVQEYDDGMAFKPRDELEKYAPYVDGRWVILGGHPKDGIISERDQISGRTVNPRYVKDLLDPKTKRTNRAGVRADIQIFNDMTTKTQLDDMKSGAKPDVSIGFFFSKDETPGTVESDSCKGQEYDYVQRDMFHDHTAACIDNGRCPSPLCGLGADEMKRMIIGDPFAGYETLEEAVADIKAKHPDLSDEQVDAICGKLKSEHDDTITEDDNMVKAGKVLRMLLEEEIESLRGERDALKETKEWWMILDWKNDEKLAEAFNLLDEEIKTQIIDAGNCPSCGEKVLGADMSIEEIDAKLGDLKTNRDGVREKMRAVEEELYSETPEEKKKNSDLRNQINQFWDEISDINDEIYAYGQAKSIKITEGALNDDAVDVKETNPGFTHPEPAAEKECPEGHTWNAKQKKCVKIENFVKKDEVKKLDVYEVLKRADELL